MNGGVEPVGAETVVEPGAAKRLFERGRHAGELERDSSPIELVEEVVEHRGCGRVEVADRGGIDEHGPSARVGGRDEPQGLVAEERGVCEEELVGEAEQDEPRDGRVLRMTVDAAEAIVLIGARLACRAPEDSEPRSVARLTSARSDATTETTIPGSTPSTATATKPTIASRASSWSMRHSRRNPRTSTSPITAAMMMAASVACGRPSNSGVRNNIVAISSTATTSPESRVRTPAAEPTALRERLASTGKPCSSPAPTFAAPSATSSWFGSIS